MRPDERHPGIGSVAGVAAATGVVEASLGAAAVAAVESAARAATGEAGFSAIELEGMGICQLMKCTVNNFPVVEIFKKYCARGSTVPVVELRF